MALGLGFGAAIGWWTEDADDDVPTTRAESRPADAGPSRSEAKPSILGELRTQRSQSTTPQVAPTPPSEKKLAAAPSEPEAVSAAPSPAWLRNAIAVADTGDRPVIAIVIDDAGLNREGTARLNSLPAPLTISFMSYADDLARQTAKARAAGHEIFLHVPMAPQSKKEDPGPNALSPELSDGEMLKRLSWALSRVDAFVGVNNHMGSRFTQDEKAMAVVLNELKNRGLAFLDSRTTEASVASSVAKRIHIPFAARDVFLDHEINKDEIRNQLSRVEETARRRGSAIAIGHPHLATIEALRSWLPSLAERGFVLVPVSTIIKRRTAG